MIARARTPGDDVRLDLRAMMDLQLTTWVLNTAGLTFVFRSAGLRKSGLRKSGLCEGRQTELVLLPPVTPDRNLESAFVSVVFVIPDGNVTHLFFGNGVGKLQHGYPVEVCFLACTVGHRQPQLHESCLQPGVSSGGRFHRRSNLLCFFPAICARWWIQSAGFFCTSTKPMLRTHVGTQRRSIAGIPHAGRLKP